MAMPCTEPTGARGRAPRGMKPAGKGEPASNVAVAVSKSPGASSGAPVWVSNAIAPTPTR